MVFVDRAHAGRLLAGVLVPLARERPVVAALPGGAAVGSEIARALRAPLEVLDSDASERFALTGRTVIVVDDGLTPGEACLRAVRALRSRGAERIVIAVPVAASEAATFTAGETDEVISLTLPSALVASGVWYRDATPVSATAVLGLLEEDVFPVVSHPLWGDPEEVLAAAPG